jgi:hypothetical protein
MGLACTYQYELRTEEMRQSLAGKAQKLNEETQDE